MIALLTGKVVEQEPKGLILDVQGVGYRVRTVSSLANTVALGEVISLRIHHQISDDFEALYGFATAEDLRFFELLLTVPSVGPKTALNILDVAPPKVLAQAVASNDLKLLTKISGVGQKTADRILVELKNKFKDIPITGIVGGIHEETMSVLINMGYSRAQARDIVRGLPTGVATVEEAIKTVLRKQ